MSKHDLKAVKLQVERFINKILGSKIFSDNPIVYSDDGFDMSDPNTLITRAYGEANFGDGSPDVSLWDGSPIDQDKYVTHPIGLIEYMFRSKIDGNTSEPSFEPTLGAWTRKDLFGPISSWFSGYPFTIGSWVTGDSNSNIYESLIDDNEDNEPSASSPYWVKVGAYKGFWNVSGTYQLNDVVLDSNDGNRVYVSNEDNNTKPLSDHGSDSTWQLIGAKSYIPDSPLTFTQANLVEVYEGNYSLSFDLPDDKSITSIETKQGTAIRRLGVSQVVTNTANNPNTIIDGFDNNSAQTITIKIG